MIGEFDREKTSSVLESKKVFHLRNSSINPMWCVHESCEILVEPVQAVLMYRVRDPNRTHCGEYECRIVPSVADKVDSGSNSHIGLAYRFCKCLNSPHTSDQHFAYRLNRLLFVQVISDSAGHMKFT